MKQHDARTVLVTGAAGYIGTVVSGALLSRGYRVHAVDNLMYGSHSLKHLLASPDFSFHRADITVFDKVAQIFAETRPAAVVHLAAIVGDPASKLQPERTVTVNRDATIELYQIARSSGARRFVFASTCSNYGLSESDELLTEDSPLQPLSVYATSKVDAERWLIANADARCAARIFRFSTAHGLSPRMRFDLTINEFTRTICERQTLEVYDGDTWRPYCHVIDIAEVLAMALEREVGAAACAVYNVGSNGENCTKADIIQRISAATGLAADVRNVGAGKDRRNYRVSFDKLRADYQFTPRFSVAYSARQIHNALQLGAFPRDAAHGYGNV
jgi:nucleoside-diphosphate-sugar epimerase